MRMSKFTKEQIIRVQIARCWLSRGCVARQRERDVEWHYTAPGKLVQKAS
jgi:hypothetical protein